MSVPGGASNRRTTGTNRKAAKIETPGATDQGKKNNTTNEPGSGKRNSRGGATEKKDKPDDKTTREKNTT
ncbi:fimbrial protein, partial [Klebsiella pneumoniae]